MLRGSGVLLTQDQAQRLEGRLQAGEQLEFIQHSVDTTEHCAPACTALSC